MKLTFLVPNNAWVFLLGESLVRMEDRSGAFPMFFQARKEAVDAARLCGLLVRQSGAVEVAR